MHCILAVAASHYRYHRKSPRQRCSSEIFHSMQACSGLRQHLDTPAALRADNIDAAITTSMFLGSLSFADATEDYQVALDQRPVPFFWLSNQRSLGSLLSMFQSPSVRRQSMWFNMFDEVAEVVLKLNDDRPGTDGIPAELAQIFSVKKTSICGHHHYLSVLRRLCRLLRVDSGNDVALLQYMQFVEGLSSHFVDLLNALDVRALTLLSYWLALLCAKECWWSLQRARNDCWAICKHLEHHGDQRLWSYMDFPAAACGYPYIGTSPAGQELVNRLRLERHRQERLS